MKVFSVLVNIIGVCLVSFMLLIVYRVGTTFDNEFEEIRLRYAVDYATEAAFNASLEVYDIGIDYDDLEGVTVNPSYCLDTFKSMICLSYDMSLSRENMAFLENYIPVAVLLCNDGFYVAKMQEVDNRFDGDIGGNYELGWNMKKPYTYIKNPDAAVSSTNPLYAFRLSSEEWVSVEPTGGGGTSVTILDGLEFPVGVTRQSVNEAVAKSVTAELNLAIEERNQLKGTSWDYTFYLPTAVTTGGVNTLEKASMLIMMQGVDFGGTGGKVDTISLGGVQAERRKLIVGFIEDNIRYYCYENQLPDALIDDVVEFFDSMEDAVSEGFYPHYIYLQNSNKIED